MFSEEDLANLTVQINLYQVLDSELIPEFDEDHDRLHHYWREIFRVVENKLGEKPDELKKIDEDLLLLTMLQNGG